MPAARVLIVSNRLPIATQVDGDSISFSQSSGGLATGLRGVHEQTGGRWIGWPGTAALTDRQRTLLDRQLQAQGIVPVHLSEEEVREYYEEFSNGVLWPLFHYMLERLPLGHSGWETYRRVNERFADVTAAEYRPGDMVWVHDYQLMLVPGLLRERLPEARIGFFLHIPFPAAEIFRTLPWRRDLVESLLGADLVGFHTYSYVQHFGSAVTNLSGVEPEDDSVWLDDRLVRFGAYPMGIDASAFERLAQSPDVEPLIAELEDQAAGGTVFLGVDRLDYTKGIVRRLLAFETLLEEDPSLRDRVRLIQVGVPSREGVPSYQEFRREVEETIGRINGTYGTVTSVPIHYLYQSVPPERLVALYRTADVMLVTSLRDGMNLVAKEYVASRIDEGGALVLSEFAGACEELPEAIQVNAYDVRAIVRGMREALEMSPAERTRRMRAMRRRVSARDVHQWANHFLAALEREVEPERRLTPESGLRDAIAELRGTDRLAVLLDYDGTLVPIAPSPEQAQPDAGLIELVRHLAKRAGTDVLIVSGRSRDTLDAWFGRLPVELWAEHGVWHKAAGTSEWAISLDVDCCDWLDDARAVMEEFAQETPGAAVESKTSSVAWHYRQAARGFGRAQARDLRLALSRALAGEPVDIIEGKKVIEVRPRGATKAAVVQHLLSRDEAPSMMLAFGDDRTDEEMFGALPPSAVSVHVGAGTSLATHRVRDVDAVRRLLSALLD